MRFLATSSFVSPGTLILKLLPRKSRASDLRVMPSLILKIVSMFCVLLENKSIRKFLTQHIKRFACLPITTCDEYDTYGVDFSGIINFNNWVTLPAEYVFLLPSSFDYLDQLITKSCLTGLALYLIGNFKTVNDVTNVPSNF